MSFSQLKMLVVENLCKSAVQTQTLLRSKLELCLPTSKPIFYVLTVLPISPFPNSQSFGHTVSCMRESEIIYISINDRHLRTQALYVKNPISNKVKYLKF